MDETKIEGRFVTTIQALVRPTVTIMFAAAVTYGWIQARLSDDAFLGLAGMTIGFWFTQRSAVRGAEAAEK